MANCLFCGDCENPPFEIVDGIFKSMKSVDDGPSVEFAKDGDDSVCHDIPFHVFKWLLKIGDDVLRELLALEKGDGNPDVCESCEPLVKEFDGGLKQIFGLQRGLGRIGNELKRRIFKDKNRGGAAWDRIRAKVKKSDVGILVDPMRDETTGIENEQASSTSVDENNENVNHGETIQSPPNQLVEEKETEKATIVNPNDYPIFIGDDCCIVFERLPSSVVNSNADHSRESPSEKDDAIPPPNVNGNAITDKGMSSHESGQAENDDYSKSDNDSDDDIDYEEYYSVTTVKEHVSHEAYDDHDEHDDSDCPSFSSNQESDDSMSTKSDIETNSEEDENSMNEPSTISACSANILSLNPCELCNEMFSCELEVEKHRALDHKVVNYARCHECNIMFPDHVRLVIHFHQAHGFIVFNHEEMDLLQFPYEAKHHISKHFCPIKSCYEVFHSEDLLAIHIKTHCLKHCYHCPVESEKTHEYAWHELSEHNANKGKTDEKFLETRQYYKYKGIGDVQFHCTRCNWSFEDRSWVIAHFLESHIRIDCSHFSLKKRPCKCKTCSMWRDISLPAKKTSSPPKCKICKAVFRSKKNLDRHMTRFHEKKNMRKIVKNGKHVLGTTSVSRVKSVRECLLHGCKKSFTTKAKLTLHMKTHYVHQEEDFICNRCGMLFRRAPALHAHKRRACRSSAAADDSNT